jgi:hypothetical protein
LRNIGTSCFGDGSVEKLRLTVVPGHIPGKGSMGRCPLSRIPNGFTTERMTFLIILEMLLTT